MKKTFRFIIAAAVAVAALASCSKEIADVNGGEDTQSSGARVIEVSFANSTKTYLGKDGLTPYFVEGDEVKVSNIEDSETCTVHVAGGKAWFVTNLEGELTAVYPATAAQMEGDDITGIIVPATQSGLFKDANIAMTYVGEGTSKASFFNCTALFKITPPAGTKKLAVISQSYVDDKGAPCDPESISTEGWLTGEWDDTYQITVGDGSEELGTCYVSVYPGVLLSNLSFETGSYIKTINPEAIVEDETDSGVRYTINGNNWRPQGALPGKFSVSSGKQVQFSKGNLQATYNDSKYTWGFAPNQYDYVGNAAGNTSIDSQSSGNIVDLFGWVGSSSSFTGPAGYGISTSKTDSDYGNVSEEALKSDWGTAIDDIGTWRTLTRNEWLHLLGRTVNGDTGEGKSYQRANINSDAADVFGMIVYPDNYTAQTTATSYTSSEWATMEAAGCVFLPAAGYRVGSYVNYVGFQANYWSSSSRPDNEAYVMAFNTNSLSGVDHIGRHDGISVRLVTDVK